MIDIDAKSLRFLVDNWVRCEPMLQRAVDEADAGFDLRFVWDEIISNRAQFWPGATSIGVSRLANAPNGSQSCICWLCAGDGLDEIRKTLATVRAWAKGIGCSRMEIIGRRGWLRALSGFRETATILVEDI